MSKSSKQTDPVQAAVLRGDGAALADALSSGAPVDRTDREGRTALFYASRDGREDLVRALLQSGASVNAKDRDGMTPLHMAARSYALSVAPLLLAAGASVDAQDSNGNTPLSDAVFESRGRPEMIALLVKAGANRHLKNEHGVSPEELAESIGNYDVAGILARL